MGPEISFLSSCGMVGLSESRLRKADLEELSMQEGGNQAEGPLHGHYVRAKH